MYWSSVTKYIYNYSSIPWRNTYLSTSKFNQILVVLLKTSNCVFSTFKSCQLKTVIIISQTIKTIKCRSSSLKWNHCMILITLVFRPRWCHWKINYHTSQALIAWNPSPFFDFVCRTMNQSQGDFLPAVRLRYDCRYSITVYGHENANTRDERMD